MTIEIQDKHEQRSATKHVPARNTPTRFILNALIVSMLVMIGYFSYAFISRNSSAQPENEKNANHQQRVIQLDVLNGCGTKGAGAKFTNYLRANGFDVVEMKNYKTFKVPHTLVVDRVGDLSVARRVAVALGVSENNVIQQINPDYFVDVSVIIGEDHPGLRPSR
ncbi:MAG: LytR C-terminal domain-containing protein [Ignavibacteria bacterium]|nr:LytR C-terminal domain-containing protein [Ignavibacteria bacterium]